MKFELAYSTYFGGSEHEQAREVIPLQDGSVFVGGQTMSSDMTTTPGVVQPKYAGDDPSQGHGGLIGGDCFLLHLGSDGDKIIASTYFGGSKQERNVYGMSLDRNGNIVFASATRSSDIRVTPGCWQSKYSGGVHDGFAAKITPDFKRVIWATYLGGIWPRGGIGLDAQDNVCIVGNTDKPGFPTTPGVMKRAVEGQDAVLIKLKSDGSGLVWSTLFGGSGKDEIIGIRFTPTGEAYVFGHTTSENLAISRNAAQRRLGGNTDGFAAIISADASRALSATYLGGSGQEFAEHRVGIANNGDILATGFTSSADFPTTEGAFQRVLKGNADGFLARISPDCGRFVFSTLYGGSGTDFWLMPTTDAEGNIYIVGQTSSKDLPVTPDAFQPEYGGGSNDGALAVFSPDGARLLYATYLGGDGDDMIRSIALGPDGDIYLVGHTASGNFPVSGNAVQRNSGGKNDAFITRLRRINR